MNVLSDFEIRIKRSLQDNEDKDRIYLLNNQITEKNTLIIKQAEEIEKLKKKIAKTKPDEKTLAKKERESAKK
jgi:uncharacterized coiled-coil protein SlyX